MPLPTTRVERFRWRQRRYRRRARKAYQSNWQYAWNGERWKRDFRPIPLWHGPKQLPPMVRPSWYTFELLNHWALPELWVVITPAEYRVPPVIAFTAPWYVLMRAGGKHQRDLFAGYHRRRVFAWRNKPVRLNGWQRRVWFANVYYFRNGFFPLVDPLHRQPDEVTVWDDPSTAGPGGVMPDPFGME